MKELIITFLICLAIGSWLNSTTILPWGQKVEAAQGQGAGTLGAELIAEVDQGSFQGMVMDAKEPVLVEFYTDSCPVCVKVAPTLSKLAFDSQGIIRVCKINASKNQALSDRYGVTGVPAFLLFENGQMIESTAGGLELSDFRAWLANHNIRIPERNAFEAQKPAPEPVSEARSDGIPSPIVSGIGKESAGFAARLADNRH